MNLESPSEPPRESSWPDPDFLVFEIVVVLVFAALVYFSVLGERMYLS